MATNRPITKQIDTLWTQFREKIDAAYRITADADADVPAKALRDYVQNYAWSDKLMALLNREIAHERAHRRGAPSNYVATLSAKTAAKLIIMSRAAEGAHATKMPPATDFLIYRDTAAEATVIGWLARKELRGIWCADVEPLNYADIMAAGLAEPGDVK